MAKRILAIDPGNKETAFVLIDEAYNIYDKAKTDNETMLDYIVANKQIIGHIVVEMIASYGMAVGAEVFETCVMIGMISTGRAGWSKLQSTFITSCSASESFFIFCFIFFSPDE